MKQAFQADLQPAVADMTPQCEEALCRFILKHAGIIIQDHQLAKLRSQVTISCTELGYQDCEAYLAALESGGSSSPELESLIAGATVGESYFFRDSKQFDWLRQDFLPNLIQRRRDGGERTLRIWSAGSSQGQEIYSIAILLHELLPDINDWALHLLGTDINVRVLSEAMRGRYREWSFRATPDDLRKRYFRSESDHHFIQKTISQRVKFAFLNLTLDSFPSIHSQTNALDLILCRNVFIYLAPSVSSSIMDRFSACLNPDGAVLLGPADMVDIGPDLRLQQADEIFFYQKAKPISGAVDELPSRISVAPTRPAPVQAPRTKPIGKHSAKKPAIRRPSKLQPDGSEPQALSEEIVELSRAGAWRQVVTATEKAMEVQGRSPPLLCHLATAFANLGELDRSATLCREGIKLYPEDKHAYLVLGLIMVEKERFQEAETSFRKAIYLDRAFLEAHFHLGMLLQRLDRNDAAIKSLHNALNLAKQGDPERLVHNAPGMTYGRFAQLLHQELAIAYGLAGVPSDRRDRTGLRIKGDRSK